MPTIKPPRETSPHYSPGIHPIAFVFSVPGQREKENREQISGRTGANLDAALATLNARRPDLFPTLSRNAYRITNSFPEPMWRDEHGRTEPRKSEVMSTANIARVRAEVTACQAVVLCGVRAGWLRDEVQEEGRTVVEMCHTADRSLLFKYRKEREAQGLSLAELWATELCEKLVRRAP